MSKVKKQDNTQVVSSIPKVEIDRPTPSYGVKTKTTQPFLFDKQNYMIVGVGLALIILGFLLMRGGRSADPNVFDEGAIYSFTRITLAPILVLLGLAVEGYAIMRKPQTAE